MIHMEAITKLLHFNAGRQTSRRRSARAGIRQGSYKCWTCGRLMPNHASFLWHIQDCTVTESN